MYFEVPAILVIFLHSCTEVNISTEWFCCWIVGIFFANLYICCIFYNTLSNAWKIYLLRIRQITVFEKTIRCLAGD